MPAMATEPVATAPAAKGASEQQDYILNVKNKKFHKPDCSAASDISSANKQDFTGIRDQLIARGYSPLRHLQTVS